MGQKGLLSKVRIEPIWCSLYQYSWTKPTEAFLPPSVSSVELVIVIVSKCKYKKLINEQFIAITLTTLDTRTSTTITCTMCSNSTVDLTPISFFTSPHISIHHDALLMDSIRIRRFSVALLWSHYYWALFDLFWTGRLGWWCDGVTNMSRLFEGRTKFNNDICRMGCEPWDVSHK